MGQIFHLDFKIIFSNDKKNDLVFPILLFSCVGRACLCVLARVADSALWQYAEMDSTCTDDFGICLPLHLQ